MQRTYRERKYTCGDYIGVAIYPVYTQTRGQSKRKKPTSEVQQRLNRRHSTDRQRALMSSTLMISTTPFTRWLATRPVTAKHLRVFLQDISNNNINKNKQRLSPLLNFLFALIPLLLPFSATIFCCSSGISYILFCPYALHG